MTLEWNCSEHRCLAPANAINYAAEHDEAYSGFRAKLIHISSFLDYLNPAIQDIIGPSDLIIVQRNVITPGVLDVIRYWQGLNKVVAIDLDDDYPGLPWSNPAHAFWQENSAKLDPPPLQVLEQGLHITNALISPSKQILRDWAHVCRGYHVPNFFRSDWWLNTPTRAEQKAKLGLTGRIVIGWGGSVSHYDSWWGSGLRDAARNIALAYPDVTFLVCGNDTRIYNQLNVPLRNKHYQPGVSPEQWPAIVKAFDNGVAPLSGTFDQRRSWIKTAEYGLAGVPWIAQAGEPYREHAGLGELIPPDVVSWEKALRKVLEDLLHQQLEANERIPLYQQWFINNQVPLLEKRYREIIANASADNGQLPHIYWVNWQKKPSDVAVSELDSGDHTRVAQDNSIQDTTDKQPDPAQLSQANLTHLAFLESAMIPVTLKQVNLVQSSSYDLIQILNDLYLGELTHA